MKRIKVHLSALLLAAIGSSAYAGVIEPIATSGDGGYTATGAWHDGTAQATGSRMGAGPAMSTSAAPRSVDLFTSADGTPMGLGGIATTPAWPGNPGAPANAAMGMPSGMAGAGITRGNVE